MHTHWELLVFPIFELLSWLPKKNTDFRMLDLNTKRCDFDLWYLAYLFIHLVATVWYQTLYKFSILFCLTLNSISVTFVWFYIFLFVTNLNLCYENI